TKPVIEQTPTQQQSQPAPQVSAPQPAQTAPVASQPVEEAPEPVATERNSAPSKSRSAKKKQAASPVILPGQIAVESNPEGAQVQVDGKTDASWVTPFALTNVQPGQHSITVSKPG